MPGISAHTTTREDIAIQGPQKPWDVVGADILMLKIEHLYAL